MPGSSLHQLAIDSARESPDRPAVVAEDGALSYGALDRLANGLAARLRGQASGPATGW